MADAKSTEPAASAQPYEVIARKYRPQQFVDVVGQDHVITTLKNAIDSNRVHHAYMFVGPRGTGKTSTARIFAKALNYKDGPTSGSTADCDICDEITAGTSLDVLEIDGASNNGVEQVRELRDSARFAPTRCRYKIYIIDEVHMLSIAAFNALLKILEEPPPHVKFFFATTEPHKVPVTILSRCQRFDLRRISAGDIVGRLSEICKAEGVGADEAALLAVARGADGGMRDAQSALDQLISFQGKEIKEEHVLAVFGLVSHDRILALATAVLAGDMPELITIVAELDKSGKDLRMVLIELLQHFRNLLLFVYTGTEAHLGDLTELQRESLRGQAETLKPGRLTRIVDILIDTHDQLVHALNKRTTIEMALIRAGRAASLASIDEIVHELSRLSDGDSDASKKKALNNPSPPTSAAPAPVSPNPAPQPPKLSASVTAVARPPAQPVAPPQSSRPPQPVTPPPSSPPAASMGATAPAPSPSTPPNAGKPRDNSAFYDHPKVKQVLETFSGDIVNVTPPNRKA